MNVKNKKLGKVNLVSTIVFIAVAVFYLINENIISSGQKPSDPTVPVVSVADGDTVTVKLGKREEKIRLIGIDAPELAQKPWGGSSRQFLESLLNSSGWKVSVEYDVEKRDKYGRLLAYLRTTDGQFINLLMVKNGYALLYTFPPNVKYVNELKAAQSEARSKKLGIWGDKGLREKPSTYRREHPRKY